MPDRTIAQLFRIKRRYLRSAHLERDFLDPTALDGYVVTDFARNCFARVAQGLNIRSGQRAWRMTGDYGSGKSSFALALAHGLGSFDKTLPPAVRELLESTSLDPARPHFASILITCSREPLGISILRALLQALRTFYGRKHRSQLSLSIEHCVERPNATVDDFVLKAISDVNEQLISDKKARGLLLILDEMGKFLEFAALKPQGQDVFLLQRLAEMASRSGDQPVLLVGLLHQGFNAYADSLSQSAQREWEKVAGRFEEIVFEQPVEQVCHLIASALNIDTKALSRNESQADLQGMEHAIRLGWYGRVSSRAFRELAPRLHPLHASVVPVLIRIFKRFGQNERSLFSFLLSGEPFGLQDFAGKHPQGEAVYRLHDLYDYVRTNLGHRLTAQSYRSHWSLIDSVVESYTAESEDEVRALKTVGLLNLLNEGDMCPTQDALLLALNDATASGEKQVLRAIERLQKNKRVLYDRGRARGYCLWPHTSVDLEKAYDDARRAVESPKRVAALLEDLLETRPLVARRHYIETGNLRFAELRYCPVSRLEHEIGRDPGAADGVVLIPLCETPGDCEAAENVARNAQWKDRKGWLMAVPQPLSNLAALVHEVYKWEWVAKHTVELAADRHAREEVARQQAAAQGQLETRVQVLLGLKQLSGDMSMKWFHMGQPLVISNGRKLLGTLSTLFDEMFALAPRIQNELVNRASLSSAGAAARMKLIDGMINRASQPLLGMDTDKRPPEMSMYLSVLQKPGIHRQVGDAWRIGSPAQKLDVDCAVLPSLQRIGDLLKGNRDRRVSVQAIFADLRKPPYGVRDGLLPIFLLVYALENQKDIAFYKDGTFLRELTAESFLVLTKSPEKFEIQLCRVEGVRADLFEKLLAVLDVEPQQKGRADILDVVRPLCAFVGHLPAYAQNTKRLTAPALAVRQAILAAREPATLLFTDLPRACEFDPVGAHPASVGQLKPFVKALKSALDELRAAFPELQDRLRELLSLSFGSPRTIDNLRIVLAERAERVALSVSEPKLRAFCLRLMDGQLPEPDWLESIGSYLAFKPPSKWHDADEDLFRQELASLVSHFLRTESILFSKGDTQSNEIGVRLAITQSNGIEHEQIIRYTADEESALSALQKQFESLIDRNRRLGLAAASRALWNTLEKTQ